MAAANGHLDVVEYVLSKGVDPNASNLEKNTPLHWACLNGHVEVVKKLILFGANVALLNSSQVWLQLAGPVAVAYALSQS